MVHAEKDQQGKCTHVFILMQAIHIKYNVHVCFLPLYMHDSVLHVEKSAKGPRGTASPLRHLQLA